MCLKNRGALEIQNSYRCNLVPYDLLIIRQFLMISPAISVGTYLMTELDKSFGYLWVPLESTANGKDSVFPVMLLKQA